MAIQSRRGNKVNFDKDKMLPGEFGVALDSQEAFICFGAGITKKMATDEDFADMINKSVTVVTTAAEEAVAKSEQATNKANVATDRANTAAATAEGIAENKTGVNDNAVGASTTWSSNKINTSLANQIGTANGASINLPNSFNGGLLLKELQGKSVQNGTPTPDNKVDIISVGDDGKVVTRVTGQNMLNFKITELIGSGITYVQNSDGTITLNGTATTRVQLNCTLPYFICDKLYANTLKLNGSYTGSVSYVMYDKNWGGGRKTEVGTQISENLSPTTQNDYMYFRVQVDSGTVCNNLVLGCVVQRENITAYKPYKEQLITIPLTQPLRSVGSVYDRGGVKSNGLWGNERKLKYLQILSTMDMTLFQSQYNDTTLYFGMKATDKNTINGAIPMCLCNCFQIKDGATVWDSSTTTECVSFSNADYGLRIRILKSRLSSQDMAGIRAFLQSNQIYIIYELATPTFEPFTQAIQDKLNALQTYQGVTNVFTTDPLQPTIVVQYGKTDTSALSIYANNIHDSKVDKANVANNLVTTQEGFVADARTVKTLKDSVDVLNNNLTDLIAINELNIGTFTANTLKTVDVSIPAKSLIIGYQGTVGNNDIKQATPLCASDGRIVGVCALSSATQDIFIRFMTFK